MTEQTWPTDEELADYTKAVEIGPATMYLTVARQVAAREKAAAEKAWDEGQLAGCENLAGSFHGRTGWKNPYRADADAGEGER